MLTCPKCGAQLHLVLQAEEQHPEQKGIFNLHGLEIELSDSDINTVARRLMPEPIDVYYVRLSAQDGQVREFPPVQVVFAASKEKKPIVVRGMVGAGTARRVLATLGFCVLRRDG